MILFDPKAERAMLATWTALRLAERLGEAWAAPVLRKARARAARALCSAPREARQQLRHARCFVVRAGALTSSALVAMGLRRAHELLTEAIDQ